MFYKLAYHQLTPLLKRSARPFLYVQPYYSVLKLFTGFATADFSDWNPTVNIVISKANPPAIANTHH